jgi:site-specific recombinase XerD
VEEGRNLIVMVAKKRKAERPPQGPADLVEAFLVSKQVAGVSSNTSTSYRMWLDDMVEGLRGNRPDPLAVQRYIASLRERGLAEGSVHKVFSVAPDFLPVVRRHGSARRGPVQGLLNARSEDAVHNWLALPGPVFTQEEANKLALSAFRRKYEDKK